MGHRIAYRRVSSADQTTSRQLDSMEFDKEFEDKASGSTTCRPALIEAIRYAREGDTLVVHSIDRLARSLGDLEGLIARFNKSGVAVEFIKEKLTFTVDNNEPMARMQLQMMGAFAQFERSMIRERQREGIAAAKKAGRHLGRTKTLTESQEAEIKRRVTAGESKKALAEEFGVSRQTVYTSIKRLTS